MCTSVDDWYIPPLLSNLSPLYSLVHHGTGNFLDAAQREKYLERQAMHAARMMANDKMEEVVPVSMHLAASTPSHLKKTSRCCGSPQSDCNACLC